MMYQKRNNFWPIVIALSILMSLVGLAGCGGGTVGSGDADSIIAGRVLTRAGLPLVGGTVTHAQTGITDITNDKGGFELQTKLSDEAPELFIDKNGVTSSITLENINPGQKNIEVIIVVDETTGIVDSVQIIGSNVEPTPSPSSSNSFTQRLLGQVKSKNGKGLDSVSIRVHGQSQEVRSNADGRFVIKVLAKSSKVKLDLTYNKLKGSVTLTGLPTNKDSTIEFLITLTIVSSQPDPGHPDEQRLDLTVKGVEVN